MPKDITDLGNENHITWTSYQKTREIRNHQTNMNERETKKKKKKRYIPLRRTSSLASSPFCINLAFSISIESLTSGMSLASDMFETRPSLRPVGTSYAGPFACMMNRSQRRRKTEKDQNVLFFFPNLYFVYQRYCITCS